MAKALQSWREHAGGTAWPTIVLATGTLIAWVATVVAHASGSLATGPAALSALALAYVAFTPLHEAVHGNVGGKGRG